MGLVDAAIPIIIDEQHLGNVFSGQLFTEPPDEGYFVNQARQYGFDEAEYLAAMRRVPLLSEENLRKNLCIIHSLVQTQADHGLQYKRQCIAEDELRESREKYRQIFENLQEVYYEASLQGELLEVSPSVKSLTKYTREELIGKSLLDLYADSKERDKLLTEVLTREQIKNHKVHL